MKNFIFITISLFAMSCLGGLPENAGDSAPIIEDPVGGGPGNGNGNGTNPAPWSLRKYLQDSLGIDQIPKDLKVVAMVNEEGKRVLALNTRDPQIRVYIDKATGRTSLKNLNVNPPKKVFIDDFEKEIAANTGALFTVNNQIKDIYAGWQSGPNKNSFPPIAQLAFQHLGQILPGPGAQQSQSQGSRGAQNPVGGGHGDSSSGTNNPSGHTGQPGTGEAPKTEHPTTNQPPSKFKEMGLDYKRDTSQGVKKADLLRRATETSDSSKSLNVTKFGKIEMQCVGIACGGKEVERDITFYLGQKGNDSWLSIEDPNQEAGWSSRAKLLDPPDGLGTVVAETVEWNERQSETLPLQYRIKTIKGPNDQPQLMIQWVQQPITEGMNTKDPKVRYGEINAEQEKIQRSVAAYCKEKLPDAEKVDAGRTEFKNKCMVCHDGEEKAQLIGNLKTPPKKGGSGSTILAEAIRRMNLPKGTTGRMPGEQTVLSAKEIDRIKAYLEDAASKE